MYCKNCQAELPEDETLCPFCGTENAEQAAPCAPEAAAEETPVEATPTAEEVPAEEAEAPAEEVPAEEAEASAEEVSTEEVPAEEAAETPAEEVSAEEAVAVSAEEAPVEEAVEASAEEASEEAPAEDAAEASAEEAPAEETEAPAKKKHKALKITLAAVGCVVLLCGLVLAVIYGVNGTLKPKANDIYFKESYTVSDADAQKAAGKTVAKIGDEKLTNGELQIFYWMQVYNFLDTYGSYASYFGMDYTQPLDTQSMSEDMTWQQYFLEAALKNWQRYETLYQLGEKNGVVLDPELQAELDSVREKMDQTAADSGYDTVDEMLHDEMGAGCSMDDYVNYITTYYKGYQYFAQQYEALDPTDEEISAYFDENTDSFASNGVAKDGSRLVDVRHVLIVPEGGTEGTDGTTYTDEAWEACRQEAQALLDEWVSGGADETSFSEMAVAHSADTSASAGGLIENIPEGKMVAEFEDWCFDESRAPGDYGLVRTKYGYHLMYFVNSREKWYSYAKNSLLTELSNQMIEDAMADYPMTVNYKKIVLSTVDLG